MYVCMYVLRKTIMHVFMYNDIIMQYNIRQKNDSYNFQVCRIGRTKYVCMYVCMCI